MAEENEALIRRFCEAWSRRDVDELLGYFTPDGVYHNMPLEPAEGHDAIRGVLELFVPSSDEITFEVLAIASAGDTVFAERMDVFRMGSKEIRIPATGVFEISDGKITAWRDYFDFATWTNQMQGS